MGKSSVKTQYAVKSGKDISSSKTVVSDPVSGFLEGTGSKRKRVKRKLDGGGTHF